MTDHLLADIGGTHARFALLSGTHGAEPYKLQVGMYGNPVQAIRHFLNSQGKAAAIDCAVIAAAGPVSGGRCKLTNADWTLDSDELKRAFGLSTVNIVNDLEALAWALPRLAPVDCQTVGRGHPVAGEPMAVIAPGTGLGMACFIPSGGGTALAGEGGHATLAATNAEEAALIALLQQRHRHVSAERVLSGQGLVSLYQALAEQDGEPIAPRTPAEITGAAMDGSCARSRRALDYFCAFLGSVAGDVALMFGARGGVYIGGGIVPKIMSYLPRTSFRARFESKGRLQAYLARVPTRVIVRPDPTFLGLRLLAEASAGAADEQAA
jgi:glucokinase